MPGRTNHRFLKLDWAIYLHELELRVNSQAHVEANELKQSQASCEEADFQSLLAKTRHRNWVLREQAARELGAVRHPDACRSLIMLLKDEHYCVGRAAMHSLINNKRCSVRPLLEELTRDFQSTSFRKAVHYVFSELHHLGELTGEEVRVLQMLASADNGLAVAQIANEALISGQMAG
jgi:hypothetical protein